MKNRRILVLLSVAFASIYGCGQADRDSSGQIVEAGTINAFEVKVGDCFDDADSEEFLSLPAVPCSEPHDNEAYAVFNVSLPSYPGDDEMWQMAYEGCLDRFEGFVGLPYEDSRLDIFTLYPTSGSWAQNDREVVCAVYDIEQQKLTGSVRGSGM